MTYLTFLILYFTISRACFMLFFEILGFYAWLCVATFVSIRRTEVRRDSGSVTVAPLPYRQPQSPTIIVLSLVLYAK